MAREQKISFKELCGRSRELKMFSAVLRDRLQIRKQGEKWQENHMETIALS